jgi:hypothetical protein
MSIRFTKGGTVAAGAAAAALLVAAGAGTASAATRSSSAPTCGTGALTASVRTAPGQVGAGNVGAVLALTNTSHQTCTVQGHPGLGLQNAHHQNQHINVAWGSTYFAKDPGAHPVTLRPGQSAYAAMAWNQPNGVRSITPAYLLVTPPDQTRHLTIPFTPGPINAGTLQVTSLAATPPGSSADPVSVSVSKFTDNGPVRGVLRPGDTADVVVSGCNSGAQGGTATSAAFVGGSAPLLPSADRPTLQGFPTIAAKSGTFAVHAQCPDSSASATTTVTVG